MPPFPPEMGHEPTEISPINPSRWHGSARSRRELPCKRCPCLSSMSTLLIPIALASRTAFARQLGNRDDIGTHRFCSWRLGFSNCNGFCTAAGRKSPRSALCLADHFSNSGKSEWIRMLSHGRCACNLRLCLLQRGIVRLLLALPSFVLVSFRFVQFLPSLLDGVHGVLMTATSPFENGIGLSNH